MAFDDTFLQVLFIQFIFNTLLFLSFGFFVPLEVFLFTSMRIIITIIINFKNQMEPQAKSSVPLTIKNFRGEINKMFTPHKEKIKEASNHFKEQYRQYKNTHLNQRSLISAIPIAIQHQRSPSLLSQVTWQQDQKDEMKEKNITQPSIPNTYDLRQWQAAKALGFKNSQSLLHFYNELFSQRKVIKKNQKRSYDFKQDEKELLIKLYNELKGEDGYVTFNQIISFFEECTLYYLCYNIKPMHLQDLLKESAHQKNDRLSLTQFLNFFFIDRPNIVRLTEGEDLKVKKRCILTQQNWNELKNIFLTLDTFGNETIHISPFIFKIKNNYSNRALINQPAIEYPEINRTLSIKKVIFNVEHRYKFTDKVEWKDIQDVFKNYEHRQYPTIDMLYKKMIERGEISKFTNYFMLSPNLIEEIKKIFYRCPKYCDFFVKTKFICKELLESSLIKKNLREAIVRIIQQGTTKKYIKLQEQIRIMASEAQDFLDLDELLEYFSIKGLFNTAPDVVCQWDQDQLSEELNEQRLQDLDKRKSLEKKKTLFNNKKGYKPVRHLTVTQQFQLSKQKGESTMSRKTRLMKEEKEAEIDRELKNKFKANPIPADLNPQRYRSYMKKMEDEKEIKRQQFLKKQEEETKIYQYLKTNTLLFTKKEAPKYDNQYQHQSYSFIPKPIPWHLADTDMLAKIDENKKLRRKKIATEAKIKMLREWKKLPNVAQQFSQPSDSFIPECQQSVKEVKSKVKDVPDFQSLHRQFSESLEKARKDWKPTIPIEFNLTSPKIRRTIQEPKEKPLKKVNSHKIVIKEDSPNHKASVQTYIVKQKVNIPTTVKYQDMVNYNQEKVKQQLQQKQIELRQELQRKEKLKNFAKFMRKKLKQSLHKSQSLHNLTQSKIKKHNEEWKILQRQNQEDLCRMYVSVMDRPFLFENDPKIDKYDSTKKNHHLVKKSKKGHKQSTHKTSKHIHESPLKAYEPQQDPSQKNQEPFRFQPEPCHEEQEALQYLNQSF